MGKVGEINQIACHSVNTFVIHVVVEGYRGRLCLSMLVVYVGVRDLMHK